MQKIKSIYHSNTDKKLLDDIEFKHMIQELMLGWWKKHNIDIMVGHI